MTRAEGRGGMTQRSKEDYAEKQAGPGHRAQVHAMRQMDDCEREDYRP